VTVADAPAPALRAVAARVLLRKEELARQTVDRYLAEIVGYRGADESELTAARAFAARNVELLLDRLERTEPVTEEFLVSAREVAARRAHRGVSLDALLHQGRLWGETVWEAVLAEAQRDCPEEREAALRIAGRLWRYVDVVSTAMAHAYLDEITDRGLLGRDLLDSLLAGQGDDERVRRLARMLHRRLGDDHVVVVIRGAGVASEVGRARLLPTRAVLDHIVDGARTHLCPAVGSLLVGVRLGDVVVLYPSPRPGDQERIKQQCAALAGALRVDVSIGMSGWHAERYAIADAYAEAREAVEIAVGTGIRGRAVALNDVLIDHMLRATPHAAWNLREALRPLVEYDREHQSELVPTLRAFVAASTNVAQTARQMTVHPNTIAYRLQRIRDLSGRDPHVMEDLQILFLALKLSELSPGAKEGSSR
jgi:sugar diacid utilization regulator